MDFDRQDGICIEDGWHGPDGVRVGHATHPDSPTGCTVFVFPRASAYGISVTGGAASTRQVSALMRGHSVSTADAFLFVGGSAYGLDAAGGVMRRLEALGRGTHVGGMFVPSVPTAALFDLPLNPGGARPEAPLGAGAFDAAVEAGVAEGRIGAGAGATVGKVLGPPGAMRGGFGAATVRLPGGLVVAAGVAVNAFGNVVDPATGRFVAGALDGQGDIADAERIVLAGALRERFVEAASNTTLGLVVTNGRLGPRACGRAAVLASQAFPLCIRPCQTAVDGDLVAVVSAGDVPTEPHQIGLAGREALARAIVRAVTVAGAARAFAGTFSGPGGAA